MLRIGVREARTRLSDLLGRVFYGKEVVILERAGKPMAALVSIDLYERWLDEREQRFQVVERLREKSREVPEDEILADVKEALTAIRTSHGQSRS